MFPITILLTLATFRAALGSTLYAYGEDPVLEAMREDIARHSVEHHHLIEFHPTSRSAARCRFFGYDENCAQTASQAGLVDVDFLVTSNFIEDPMKPSDVKHYPMWASGGKCSILKE